MNWSTISVFNFPTISIFLLWFRFISSVISVCFSISVLTVFIRCGSLFLFRCGGGLVCFTIAESRREARRRKVNLVRHRGQIFLFENLPLSNKRFQDCPEEQGSGSSLSRSRLYPLMYFFKPLRTPAWRKKKTKKVFFFSKMVSSSFLRIVKSLKMWQLPIG